jgi:hypothetical protein
VPLREALALIRHIFRRENLRALRTRVVDPGRVRRTPEVIMTSQIISPAEVTFEARQDSEGRLVIGLVLTREGRSAAGDKVFTFDLVPDLTPPRPMPWWTLSTGASRISGWLFRAARIRIEKAHDAQHLPLLWIIFWSRIERLAVGLEQCCERST